MAKNGQTVKSFQDLKNLKGVDKAVSDGVGKRMDVSGLEVVVDEAMPGLDGDEGTLNDLRNFKARDFLKGHKEDTEAFLRDVAKIEEIFDGLDEMSEALRKLEDLNEKKRLRVDTPHMKELRSRIDMAKGLLERASPEAVELVRFRRDHEAIRALVNKGHAVFKALKKGEKADEKTLDELKVGYADFLHTLLREERIVEVESEQLKDWGNRHESYSDHAASWFYRDCKVCERGRCRTHWFWGMAGDDQSIQLAKDLRALNNINSRIRNHLNPRRPAPTESKPAAPTTTTLPNELEGSTPVELETGSTES